MPEVWILPISVPLLYGSRPLSCALVNCTYGTNKAFMQVICHGIPDKRPLQDGDIVNVDVSAYYKGYHGDLNETYTVGEADAASKKLIKAAHDVRSFSCAMLALQQTSCYVTSPYTSSHSRKVNVLLWPRFVQVLLSVMLHTWLCQC